MYEDFLEFCNEFIKSPALTKYTRITLGHGLQKFKNFLADTPRYSLYKNNLKMTQLTVDMVAAYVEYLKENGTGDGPKSISECSSVWLLRLLTKTSSRKIRAEVSC